MKYSMRLRPIPVVFEPSLTKFAAMLSHCDLFLTSDSGPMHLAYSLGLKTVAVFLQNNIERWGPPVDVCRVLYGPDGVTPQDVLTVCWEELSQLAGGEVGTAAMSYAPAQALH